jgi:hypothetical protein
MGKVRFQMFLDENQKEALEKLHKETKIPVAEMIRKAIGKSLLEMKQKKKKTNSDEITEKLLSVVGICKGGPKDLSDEHDKYLYSTDKK